MNATDWIEKPGEHESLAVSLRAVLNAAGVRREYDEILALLGLGNAIVSVPGECLGWWGAYGRDVGLLATAELYGVLLRELHPPTAAVGLGDAREFEQHYQDSYVPLIRRALENGQFCLAWRGWQPPRDRAWGVITEIRDADLLGLVPGCGGKTERISNAAWQVYVVEKITPPAGEQLRGAALFDRALIAGREFLRTDLAETRAILTGRAALDTWIAALETDSVCASCAERSWRCQGQLTRVLISSREHLSRWLRRVAPGLGGRRQETAERWADACEQSVAALSDSREDAAIQDLLATADGRATVRRAIERVRDIETELASE